MDPVMLKRAKVTAEQWQLCCEDCGLDEDGIYHPDWIANLVAKWRTWKVLKARVTITENVRANV